MLAGEFVARVAGWTGACSPGGLGADRVVPGPLNRRLDHPNGGRLTGGCSPNVEDLRGHLVAASEGIWACAV